MSILEIITDPTATQTVAAIGAIRPTGILDVINQQTDAGTVTFKNVIALAITVYAGFKILHSGFAWARLATVVLIGALTFFFLNGGMAWLGGQFGSQVNASAAVQVDPHMQSGESFLEGRPEL